MTEPRIIVVGGGIAGMMAAIRLAEQGIPVDLVTEGALGLSEAVGATDGLAAACDAKGEGDSFDKHFEETIRGGDYLANQELPRQMCLFGPEIAGLLDRMGVLFARSETFALDSRRLPGHNYHRLLFAETGIGRQIISALMRQCLRFEAAGKITLHEGMEFLSVVLKGSGPCYGIVAMNQKTMGLIPFIGAAVIVATAPPLSFLYQQGVALANMEFVGLGGIWVDDEHMTHIPGLLAVGDATFQYHGARKLPGNGLLASLYGGLKGARSAFRYLTGLVEGDKASSPFQDEIKRQHYLNQELLDLSGNENGRQLHEEISAEIEKNLLGPRRNKNLSQLEQQIEEFKLRFWKMTLFDRGLYANRELIFARRLKNLFDLAQVMVRGAFLRNETRGVHVKPEFPDRNDEQFLKTTKAWWTSEGPRIEYEDVNLKYLMPK